MPIQGTAADIIKISYDKNYGSNDRSRNALQDDPASPRRADIRDTQDELDELSEIVMELMPASLSLAVPLAVDLKTGDTWGDLE